MTVSVTPAASSGFQAVSQTLLQFFRNDFGGQPGFDCCGTS
jgi:hypothetical protein